MRALGASFAAGKVWVTDKANFSISEIDRQPQAACTHIPCRQFPASPVGFSATATAIWVTIGSDPSCSTAAHLCSRRRHGFLQVPSIDPDGGGSYTHERAIRSCRRD